ncbi:MAG: ribonuclease HII [Alphaproteobacteria bacterium]|jgi:ribonuclease HII|nr:ribonuclease HII [Rickettsiaceae bacterium]NBU53633.1 ribonuclease HII [Alphaproteobacteria bacterium]UCM94482.1 MAG: ribonuclease HII [Candidatus Megaira endosymbiont of Mesostigma viride]HJK88678.1 ribonuclease HII [Candidatus Megaira endosymbiont of Mesostigma viride]
MDLSIESNYQGVVAGVDEAGRGPLAGPVVAAAVIIDQNNLIKGIKDSKKLSKNKREELYVKITQNYVWSIGVVEPKEIDEINILEATKKACVLAVEGLIKEPSVVIVDGNMKFSDKRFVSYIKGDDKSISIAAASIIAKVTRDRIMGLLHQEFPYYFWAKNSGYGTKEHISAIEKYGSSIHHRLSFKLKNTA